MPELDSLLQASDIISIHCPHNTETHELMDARRIGLLKPSAYVINTSRGVIVDEGALVEALEAQRIAGAGLDVYRHEPEIDPRLLALSNVVLLPHMGSATFEGRAARSEEHTSELQSLMRISYAVFCLKKKKKTNRN